MEQNVYFERCIDFLSRMIEKYGDELLREEMAEKDKQEKSLPGKTSEDVAYKESFNQQEMAAWPSPVSL